MSIDPRDLFVSLNPTGLSDTELEKDRSGFIDDRTHSDYLIFLAGYKAGAGDGEESEYQRHRPINAEGCKPESSSLPFGMPCAGAATSRSLDKAEGCKPDLVNPPHQLQRQSEPTAGLTAVLPTVAVEGDQLVIRITTECLLHAVTFAPEWPVDYTGAPISIQNGTLLIQEIIHELQREDEQGTNQMHRLLDQAALDAINNGSEAVSYD